MSSESSAPLETAPGPIRSDDVPWEAWSAGPRFGVRYRHLTTAAIGEDYHVGVAIEELEPGRQSAPAHYHVFEEEHLFVLEGGLTVRIGDARYPMREGDYVCFPAGLRLGHCLINDGDAVCRYVIAGEHNPNEVAIYTDSGKVLVRALGRRAIFDLAARRDYWAGEDTGLPTGERREDDVGTGDPLPTDDPAPPMASADLPWHEEGRGAAFGGQSKHLTRAALGGWDYHVGVLIEAPAPGKRLCPTHYHMLEEEHALILEGQATLILGDERHAMRPGDYVCFPAGRKIGHSIVNSGDQPCRYLMIGERNRNEVCVYPDSNKMAVDALGLEDGVFDMAARRNYWDGEDGA